MQKSIAETEERIKKKMAQRTERQIMEVHQPLDIFGYRVLAWTTPTVDLKTLQDAVASLREDMDAILEAQVPSLRP